MRIKEYRQKANLSQMELAQKIGTNAATLCRWENGVRSPRISWIAKISKVLGVTMDDLVKE